MATGRVWGGFGQYQTRPAYKIARPEPDAGLFSRTQTRSAYIQQNPNPPRPALIGAHLIEQETYKILSKLSKNKLSMDRIN